MKWFKIVRDNDPRIDQVEIEREDGAHVFLKEGPGKRRYKKGEGIFREYFETWREAKDHMLTLALNRRLAAEKSLAAAHAFCRKVEDLEPPVVEESFVDPQFDEETKEPEADK